MILEQNQQSSSCEDNSSNLKDINDNNEDTTLVPLSDASISTPTISITPGASSPICVAYTPQAGEEWTRKVENELTPTIGMEFDSLDGAMEFYETYAKACGFDTRKSTTKRYSDNTIRTKKIVCHREGYADSRKKSTKKSPSKVGETSKPVIEHVSKIRRFGCKAEIVFKFLSGKYVVSQFHEGHSHELILSSDREFQKSSRKLSLYHKQAVIHHSRVNIGPSKVYRVCKEMASGYENVGASLSDFKNFQRDVKCFIGLRDTEMFINNMEKLVQSRKGFQFSYELDNGNNLCRVFWTDAQGKRAYHAFCDGMSFDPTYGTNKYCMVFSPFTGIDNHKKSVTFAGALLTNEDELSFRWTFSKFLEAMGNKEPVLSLIRTPPLKRLFSGF